MCGKNDDTSIRNYKYSRNVKTKEQAYTSLAHVSPLIEIKETLQLKKGMVSAMCGAACHAERGLAGFPQLLFTLVNCLPAVKNTTMLKVPYAF